MNILLTGGSGMVGRNILEHPYANKHKFYAPNRSELNLLDRRVVTRFFLDVKPNLIIHAAGKVGGIQANIANPTGFLSENLDVGVNVIASASAAGVPNLINLASSCMYPVDATNPLNEDLILQGGLEPTNEGYALAKIVATKLCEYISLSDKAKRYKTVIPCNLYGRHDKFSEETSHLLPSVVKKIHDAKIKNTKSVSIWGDGTARREFMCAEDLADFIFYAIDKFEGMPQNINVGMGCDFSVKHYYETVAKVIGYQGTFEFDLKKPVGMRQKLVDIKRLKEFGWSHKIALCDGIQKTYDFYLRSFEK